MMRPAIHFLASGHVLAPDSRGRLKRLRVAGGILAPARRCLACGCTYESPCDGGCWWAGPALCTSCVGRKVRLEYVERGQFVLVRVIPKEVETGA